MEDSLSVKSNESVATSEEFDIVGGGANKTPTLDVKNGDLSQLTNVLTEVLREETSGRQNEGGGDELLTARKVGQSTFYSTVESNKILLPLDKDSSSEDEKQDSVKLNSNDDEEVSDVDQDCTIFSGVSYMGAANMNAPKSEGEIQRNMAILNEQSVEQGIKVSVSVPCSSQGFVVLYDATTNSVISRFEVHRILFYARGGIDTSEAGCFAFTWSHGDTQESAIFQCHVFRCDIAEAVSRVSACFAKAFQRVPRSMSSSVASAADMTGSITTLPEARILMYVFEVSLEIKEDDGKKEQMSSNLATSNSSVLPDRNSTLISATWDPTEPSFEPLNTETPKDAKQYMTVAVDLVIRGIQEPVRFQIETPVRIFGHNERNFWYFSRKSLMQQFFLNLKEVVAGELNDIYYEVLSMETSGELDKNLLNLNLNLSSLIQSPSIASMDTLTPKEEYNSDGDEPLLSGTGSVSKDCSEDVLESWADVLVRWKSTKQPPKQLNTLVRLGIPEALRGEVWQRLAVVEENNEMMENYRLLITKECSCENVIQRDIARTFPAHDFFKEAGGLGQDSLYRVSKAYAVYDTEVGYCQGLSFLAATLLLHMPEEQAFCVLVKLMYSYGLRDLYKDGFDNLYLRLYQLNRLMEEQLAPLWQHFMTHHIETHMFASQWFLTLFTARFPLYFVFHIIDVFLLQGIDTLFQIALALLMVCKKDLLQLDFEGILKYFRVSLPKKCRAEEAAKQLVKLACSIKVKKLKKYEADFVALKEAADHAENEANEVEQLRLTLSRYEEERKLMMDEISQLKDMLKREVDQAEKDKKNSLIIINDYKLVRQRLDSQLHAVKTELDNLKFKVSSCEKCSLLHQSNDQSGDGAESSGPDEGVRELELELAQTKLAHVEAECRNQDLIHQLRASEVDLATAKNSWPPWLSKTLSSIKEVANKKDFSGFTYPAPNQQSNNHIAPTAPSFISHINAIRRDSAPVKHGGTGGNTDILVSKDRRDSNPVIKDSQSCSSLKNHN